MATTSKKKSKLPVIIGALLLAGGGYMWWRKRGAAAPQLPASGSQQPPKNNTTPPAGNSQPAGFPLQQGSRGTAVKLLQEAIIRKNPLAAVTIKSTGGADGIWGSGTQAAVVKAKISTPVSYSDWKKYTGKTL